MSALVPESVKSSSTQALDLRIGAFRGGDGIDVPDGPGILGREQ